MGDPRTLLSKDKSSFPLKTRFVRVFFWLLPCACSNEATHRRYWVFSVKSGAATSSATAAGGFALRLRKLARNASRNRSALIRSLSSASFANAILLTARCRCAARCQMASRHASRLTLSPSLRIVRHLRYCCCSSVVERVIGNDEVGSSILPSSTMALEGHFQNRCGSAFRLGAALGPAWGALGSKMAQIHCIFTYAYKLAGNKANAIKALCPFTHAVEYSRCLMSSLA